MKVLKFLLLSLFCCSAAYAADYVQGEALVTFRAPSGLEVTEDSVINGEAREFIDGIAQSVGAEIAASYGTLSEASGDKILALLRSTTKTTEELIRDLKENPNVLSASPNRRQKIMPVRNKMKGMK